MQMIPTKLQRSAVQPILYSKTQRLARDPTLHLTSHAPAIVAAASSSTSSPTPDVPIKAEQFSLLISQIIKTIDRLEAISKQGPTAGTGLHTKMCHFCSGAHFVRECGKVGEYITAGKCKRNAEGKVVLPSGIFITSDIAPGLLKDHIFLLTNGITNIQISLQLTPCYIL